MSQPTEIFGVESTLKRFARLAALPGLKANLRAEAEALAAEARARLESGSSRGRGALAKSVKVIDISRETVSAFAIGTEDRAGFFVEFGTAKRSASPWLLPALHARLPRLKHILRTLLNEAVKLRSNRA